MLKSKQFQYIIGLYNPTFTTVIFSRNTGIEIRKTAAHAHMYIAVLAETLKGELF